MKQKLSKPAREVAEWLVKNAVTMHQARTTRDIAIILQALRDPENPQGGKIAKGETERIRKILQHFLENDLVFIDKSNSKQTWCVSTIQKEKLLKLLGKDTAQEALPVEGGSNGPAKVLPFTRGDNGDVAESNEDSGYVG